jgi:DNA-binding transcriptional regulator YiaG
VTTRARSRAAEINKVPLEGSLVEGEIDLQPTVTRGLSTDCTFQRNRAVLFPLVYGALSAAQGVGGGGLGTEVSDNVGFSHDLRKYSMLNLQVKDAVQTRPYAFLAMETMGDRIKQLRRARNLTQEQFAQAVGVTKSAVSQWEDGSTKNLKLATFLLVLEVLATDAEFLIYGPERGAAAKRTWKPRPGRAAGT